MAQSLMNLSGPIDEDLMGAVKIKDGLFIGDEFSAQVSQQLAYHTRIWSSSLQTRSRT